jgi:hypothetical protein
LHYIKKEKKERKKDREREREREREKKEKRERVLKDKCLYIALQSLMKKNHPTDVPFVAADVSEEIFW